MNTAALVTGAFYLVAVGIYGFVGLRLLARPTSSRSRLAATQFGVFWLLLATLTGIQAVFSLVATVSLPSLALVETATYLQILILCAILWSLVGYLVYLFTGRSFLVPLTLFYAAYFVVLLYVIVASDPIGVQTTLGVVRLTYGAPLGGGPTALAAIFVVLILPEFVGAALYLSLYFRVQDPTVRYRVALVGLALLGWFGLGSVNIASRLGGGLLAQFADRSIGLVAALVIFLAYFPPIAIRRRFQLRRLDEPAVPETSSA